MSAEIKNAAVRIAETVAEAGGYLSYEDLDEAMKDRYTATLTLAGWGSPADFERNQAVVAAHAACELGLLTNTGRGYSCNQSTQQSI